MLPQLQRAGGPQPALRGSSHDQVPPTDLVRTGGGEGVVLRAAVIPRAGIRLSPSEAGRQGKWQSLSSCLHGSLSVGAGGHRDDTAIATCHHVALAGGGRPRNTVPHPAAGGGKIIEDLPKPRQDESLVHTTDRRRRTRAVPCRPSPQVRGATTKQTAASVLRRLRRAGGRHPHCHAPRPKPAPPPILDPAEPQPRIVGSRIERS